MQNLFVFRPMLSNYLSEIRYGDSIKESIQNQELRRQMFKMGEDDALTFLETLKET